VNVNKSFLLLLILLSSLFVVKALASNYTDVSVIEAKAMIESTPSLVILDVRNQSEYDAGHIRNAVLIPVWELASRLDELNLTDEILVYCRSGIRSASASQILASNSFLHVYNMLGGINAWTVSGNTVYVKYASLQTAIDNAAQGGVLNVSSGLYYEHLTLNKSLTLNGENKYNTVVDGGNNGTVVDIDADNVSIVGLTLQGSGCGCADYAGVYIRAYRQNVNLANNRMIQDGFGIKLVLAENITIAQNEIAHDTTAIEILLSSNNTIIENDITDNENGIELIPSSGNIITGNDIANNMIHNIMLHSSSQNTVSQNKLTYSLYGIKLYSSSNNNTFDGNTVANNLIAVGIQNSSGNTIYENNFVRNTQQVQFNESGPNIFNDNQWDDGNLSGGNYWSNYAGADSDHDGIGDSAYIIGTNNTDNYPLMGMTATFSSSDGNSVNLVSDSTVEDFTYFNSTRSIRLHVTNTTQDQSEGFFRITISHDLMLPPYNITINGNPTTYTTIYENSSLSTIYFTYQHSTLEINVVPEIQPLILLLILTTIPLLALRLKRKKRSSTTEK
jgi:nitrous oxidase accessory protein